MRRRVFSLLFVVTLGLVLTAPATAQVSPDQAADMLLDSARRAYNEKNYPFAVTRFREFLQKYGGHKNAPQARYGLALALTEGPEKNYDEVVATLQPLLGAKDMPEFPLVLYHFALGKRGQGVKELAEATAKPQEATQRKANAAARFDEAQQQFAASAAAFAARVKDVPADAKELPVDLEWAARSRCDQAEMLLRAGKTKEALAAVEPFLKDPYAKSRYKQQGLYFHGFASFLLGDTLAAGRSLNQLAPFTDPVFGTHARYLLARVHHREGERNEAALHYQGVIADFAKAKAAAVEALKQPDRFKNDPEEKARLDALAQGPPPDYVTRSSFYLGVIQYEDGKFAEALTSFTTLLQQQPNTPLTYEVLLRQGFCQVQLKQYPQAIQTLTPLVDKEPRLADQVLLWIAKAQAGAADPANPQAYDQALKNAIATYGRAAERAGQLAAADPEAKPRRAEILLEMADTQQLDKMFKEAANTYTVLLNEKALPQREDELLERLATAQHLAGDYGPSDQTVARFQQAYPKSPLLPAVLFRSAENAYFTALAAEKNPNLPNKAQELPKLFDETIKRYSAVVDKYPEFAQINLARYGLAQAYYRKGDLEKAQAILEAIPLPERTGDLAATPYFLADCLLRQAPTAADDALAAAKLEEKLKGAAEMLEGFVGAQPQSPLAPDAMIKLGLCYQRLAALMAQPPEKQRILGQARQVYEKVMQQFPKHDLQPQAVLERAKVMAAQGDQNGAINELRRFTADMKQTKIAPMAWLNLATMLRAQNKAQEAADILGKMRQEQEQAIGQDPARAQWVALVQYHHGVCLREAGKLPEARGVFNQVVTGAAGRPEAVEAALRYGQCLQQEGLTKIDAAQKRLATPNLKPEEINAANQQNEAGLKDLRDTVQFLEGQIQALQQKQAAPELKARMHYEAAWASRALADVEVKAARAKVQQEQYQKLVAEAAKKVPPGQQPPPVPLPDVPLSAVPLQPSEQKARALYQAMINGFADVPLAQADARFELAEMLADRAEFDAAIKLLKDGIDKEPPQELTDKIRIRLGACLVDKGDVKAGLEQFKIVAGNPKSTQLAQAQYRAGEALLALKEPAEAAKYLVVFRDQGPFQNLPGLTDRALLRLGHAYAELKQWEPSRQAHEAVAARFPNSPWVHEARYGMGWAWQNQKQFDQACNVYAQVTAGTTTEIAAKAQLQTGLCRLEQKKYGDAAAALLVVPFTYDYPELSAVALVEAARALAEQKQEDQAVRLLERVIKDHPNSPWAQVAKERLAVLKKT